MKRKIRETFDMIHADEELKNKTREFLAKTTEIIRSLRNWFL